MRESCLIFKSMLYALAVCDFNLSYPILLENFLLTFHFHPFALIISCWIIIIILLNMADKKNKRPRINFKPPYFVEPASLKEQTQKKNGSILHEYEPHFQYWMI